MTAPGPVVLVLDVRQCRDGRALATTLHFIDSPRLTPEERLAVVDLVYGWARAEREAEWHQLHRMAAGRVESLMRDNPRLTLLQKQLEPVLDPSVEGIDGLGQLEGY